MARTRQDGPPIGPDRAGGGAVAQLGERRNRTAEVRGSNPLGSTSSSICRCSAIGLSRSSRPNRKSQLSTSVPQRGTTDGYDLQARGRIRSPDMTRRTSAHLQDFSTFSRMLRLGLARWRPESTEMRLRLPFCEGETNRSCTIPACQDRAVASRPSR
jgi:hypothetical protein